MKSFEIKNKCYKKLLPLFSFFMILTVSVFLSGSAKLPDKNLSGVQCQLKNIRVSYKFENIELNLALKRISLDNNVKIYTENDLTEKVSACFFNSPLDDAMKSLLKGKDYSFRFYNDGILIEKKKSFSIKNMAQNKQNMKRVFVSPSFISISKVKEIIDGNKSADASVVYDEKSSIAILDETPDNADYILNKIREADRISEKYENAVSENPVSESKPALETKMFSLKNIQIKNIISEIKSKLSKNGAAYENEKINSVIVTDTSFYLKNIETFIASKEISDSATLINFKIAAVPMKIINELEKIGYNLKRKNDEGVKFLRASNKNEILGMIEPYVKFADKMAALKNDFIEIDTNYEMLKSKVKIYPSALNNGAFNINMSINEGIFIDSENAELQNIFSMKTAYKNEIFENECLLITGPGQKTADFLKCGNSFYAKSGSYLPGVAGLTSRNLAGIANDLSGAEMMFVFIVEASAGRSNKGLPKYSFVNLTKFNNGSANKESELSGIDLKNSNEGSYLQIFGGFKNNKAAVKNENIASLNSINDRANNGENLKNENINFENKPTEIKVRITPAAEKSNIKENLDIEQKLAGKNGNSDAGEFKSEGQNEKKAENVKSKNEDAVKTAKKLMNDGNLSKAKKIIIDCLNEDSSNCEALIMLGNIQREFKNFVSAKKSWERALKLAPDNQKLKDNVEKLENLIALIKSEKEKASGRAQIKEFENYLR